MIIASFSLLFLLPRFPLPRFSALMFGAENSTPAISTLHYGATISTPAFSTPANSASPSGHVTRFFLNFALSYISGSRKARHFKFRVLIDTEEY